MNEIQNIDTLTAEILILKQQTAQNIIEIGKRLLAVKESLPHGEWGKWLEGKVQFSQRSANNFMKVANEFSNSQLIANLEPTKIFKLLDLPKDEREEFIQNNPIEEMTARELQQAIKEKKDLEDKLKAAETKAKKNADKATRAEVEKNNIKEQIASVESKWKEDLANREVEIENLKMHIDRIKNQLLEAEASGDSDEVENLQQSLQNTESSLLDANRKIEELEQQLKDRPIDVITVEPIVIEKIPEEVEKELQEFREKASLNNSSDKAIIKFSVCFDGLVKQFKEVLAGLEEIKEVDEIIHGKYKNAVSGLIGKMAERL